MKRAMLVLAAACALAACETKELRAVDGERLIVRGHKLVLHGVDAPDMAKPKCDKEKEAADFAQERLGGLIMAAKDVQFRKTGMACLIFMECDAFVTADGVDVGQTLIDEGLAAKTSEPKDWCAA